MAYILII